jgi:hypothetical protein
MTLNAQQSIVSNKGIILDEVEEVMAAVADDEV